LPQYDKTKLFQIFRLLCHQQKIKLLATSIKTIKSIIIINWHIYNIFIYGTLNLFMVVRPSKMQLISR